MAGIERILTLRPPSFGISSADIAKPVRAGAQFVQVAEELFDAAGFTPRT
jgi:hypothetical protein